MLNLWKIFNFQEIDPSGGMSELPNDFGDGEGSYADFLRSIYENLADHVFLMFLIKDFLQAGKAMLVEMVGSFPGIDEAVSFSEVMK